MVKLLVHFLTLFISLAIPSLLQGQVKKAGIIAGPTFTNIGNAKFITHGPQLGNYFGAYTHLYLSENAMLKVAVVQTQKGFITDNQEYHQLKYVNLPVAYGHDIGYGFTLLTGVDVGLHRPSNNRYVIDTRALDIGVSAGFQYKINNFVGFELVFTHGVVTVFDYTHRDLSGREIGKEKFGLNRCLQLGFYLNFIKRKRSDNSI